MPCFGKKKSIVPVDEDAVGRLEGDGTKNPRDGLSSAPASQDKKQTDSARKVHSAPNTKKGGSDGTGKAAKNEPISDFILEATDGSEPTAESVDAYLADVIGSNIVKDLRSNEWAARVSGLEDLKKLVSKRAADDALVATGGGRESPVAAERLQLFRACVTVITKALNDKVVPVFLRPRPPLRGLLAAIHRADLRQQAPAHCNRVLCREARLPRGLVQRARKRGELVGSDGARAVRCGRLPCGRAPRAEQALRHQGEVHLRRRRPPRAASRARRRV